MMKSVAFIKLAICRAIAAARKATVLLGSNAIIALATVVNVCVVYWQWSAMIQNNNIAAGQLQAVLADRRPWLSVKLSAGGPISFNKKKESSIPYKLYVKNVGNSPARNITERFEVHVLRGAELFNTIPDQRRLCEQAANMAQNDEFGGKLLFPNDEYTGVGAGGAGGIAEYAKAWPGPTNVTFHIIGCVDYTFAMDSKVHGQIGVSYNIGRPIDGGVHRAGFNPDVERYDVDTIAFDVDFFHGGYLK